MASQIVRGIPEVIANLKKYQIIKTEAIKDRLKKQAFKIELAAKEMVPVKYGRAKASLTTNWAGSSMSKGKITNPSRRKENPTKADDAIGRPGGAKDLVLVVGTNVHYAPSLEHGTPKMPARPFLFPAYFMYEGETILAIAAIMKMDVTLR